MKPGYHWTAAEEEQLRRMWGVIRADEIARRLGRTASATIGKAHRLGLPSIPREQRYAWVRESYRAWMASV